MAEIEIGNKKIELDGDGFMVDPTWRLAWLTLSYLK